MKGKEGGEVKGMAEGQSLYVKSDLFHYLSREERGRVIEGKS